MEPKHTDIELIGRVVQSGDTSALGTLMKRYTSQVYRAAVRMVADDAKAADVTQLAFIQAYRQIDSWRGGDFGVWVTVIANHIALRMLEKEKRRPTVSIDGETDMPDDIYDERKEQRLQTLENAIDKLEEKDRLIIKWHYYEKLSLKEISVRLNQTEGAVKVRIHRIREKLKIDMQNEYDR